MKPIGTFPFGQPVQEVLQKDRTPKDVFVLGVYASAVHANWINISGKSVVNALAVASEPYIFGVVKMQILLFGKSPFRQR